MFKNDITRTVADELKTCPKGTIFLAAVSGGADSMAMLSVLIQLSCDAVISKESIYCLHVEHGIRPEAESRGDAEFVHDYCEKNGINCRIVSIPPGRIAAYAKRKGTGLEAAARFFRRRILFREAARLDTLGNGEKTRLLIAHTKDDLLELALMRVFRGAGPAGLGIMPVNRGRIQRPLLSVTRTEIITRLTENKIPRREDVTNTDDKFLRNKIRLRLIPVLNEFFPTWKTGIKNMAETQSLTAAFITEEARRQIRWNPLRLPSALITCAEIFFAQPLIIREEALFQGINLLGKSSQNSAPKRKVIRRFCAGFVTAVDLGLLQIRRKNGKILLSERENHSEKGFSLLIKKSGLYTIDNISIEVKPQGFAFDEKSGFFTLLPLIFRAGFKQDFLVSNGKKIKKSNIAKSDIISAVDELGIAAFISQKEILFKRDFPAAGNKPGELYFAELSQIGGACV